MPRRQFNELSSPQGPHPLWVTLANDSASGAIAGMTAAKGLATYALGEEVSGANPIQQEQSIVGSSRKKRIKR